MRFLGVSAALLSSCAVYVPTTPSTPLLRNKGEVEVAAALRSFSSLETSAAWVPAPHLLITAEAALQRSDGSITANNATTTFTNQHRQGGLGVGTYRLLGQNQATYLGAVGGVGVASASIYYSHTGGFFLVIPIPAPLVRYQASYLRYYGQVYAARQTPKVSYGASLRGTFVDYSRLQRNGAAIAPPTRFFLEPTLFLRYGQGAVQGMAAIGFSTPGRSDRNNPDNLNLAPSTTFFTAGVVLRPQLLWQRYNPEAD